MASWNVRFLQASSSSSISPDGPKRVLIILNQPFSFELLKRLWDSTQLHYCADGGANRLYDILSGKQSTRGQDLHELHVPDLIKGDLDSIRLDVRDYYISQGVSVVQDHDQDSTDLMKCVQAVEEKELAEGSPQCDIILLGGLSGRLDQTIHTLSYLHKLRRKRKHVFAVTDDNVGWVLDEGDHYIEVDHTILGQTCGLLPVGISSTTLSTSGLRWNLTNQESSFDGLVSTSNHLVPGKDIWIRTSSPIWWTAELKIDK